MLKRIILATAVPALLVLSACAAPTEDYSTTDETVPDEPTPTNPTVKASLGTVEKIEIDGITCVIFDGHQTGGISCNWSANNG